MATICVECRWHYWDSDACEHQCLFTLNRNAITGLWQNRRPCYAKRGGPDPQEDCEDYEPLAGSRGGGEGGEETLSTRRHLHELLDECAALSAEACPIPAWSGEPVVEAERKGYGKGKSRVLVVVRGRICGMLSRLPDGLGWDWRGAEDAACSEEADDAD